MKKVILDNQLSRHKYAIIQKSCAFIGGMTVASHLDFVNYVSDQLREAGAIRSRKMFGEYGLYCNDIFFGVICDDQLFVNVTPAGEAAFPSLPKAPPYEGAKDYILVEDVDNAPLLAELVTVTCEALRQMQPKRKPKSSVRIRLARPRDIDAWMALVDEVRDLFRVWRQRQTSRNIEKRCCI